VNKLSIYICLTVLSKSSIQDPDSLNVHLHITDKAESNRGHDGVVADGADYSGGENVKNAEAHNNLKTIEQEQGSEDVKSYEEPGTEEDYVYDDGAAAEADENDAGQRLVGASKAKGNDKLPFIVGYNLNGFGGDFEYTACTGSLITANWIISAAHCVGMIITAEEIEKCAKKGKNEKTSRGYNVLCTEFAGGNVKIQPTVIRGWAYFGVVDVNNKKEVEEGTKLEIDYLVWHENSYKGGGSYGDFGGYDVTLIRLKKPASSFEPACLPGPDFIDSGIGPAYGSQEQANLAGFGNYFRKDNEKKSVCMTDGNGKSKYHYCNKAGKGACNTKTNPPQSEICEEFFADPLSKTVPDGQEVAVIDCKMRSHFCFKKSSSEADLGWCSVKDDATIVQTLRTFKKSSWGYCGKDCALDEDLKGSSTLRVVENIDILDDKLCNMFLKKTLQRTVEVKPEVLCIGFKKKIKFSTFMFDCRKSKFIQVEDTAQITHPMTSVTGEDFYVHSAGTCKGDSGGPVFTFDDKKERFVVLGVVSGGRGVLAKCGGINNPTHYGRVKHYIPWVKKILAEESKELCIID